MSEFEYFPGANTPEGFYSYYDYIMNVHSAKRIIVLKGGPGTGKSTFMKKVAQHIKSKGCDTELLHCSSDPKSLDGVCSRKLGFLILDGTAPHIVDPKYPGAADEIINLGDCWEKEKILENKENIIKTGEEISAYFADAYRYLAAAKALQKTVEVKNRSLVIKSLEELKNRLSVGKDGIGTEQKAFLSALTPFGRINYSEVFLKNSEKSFKLISKSESTKRLFMSELSKLLLVSGENVRSFYCPMSPGEKIEHIYCNKMFFTADENISEAVPIYIDGCEDSGCVDTEEYERLLGMAEEKLVKAKKLHDELEEYYAPYMDFEKINEICQEVINSI